MALGVANYLHNDPKQSDYLLLRYFNSQLWVGLEAKRASEYTIWYHKHRCNHTLNLGNFETDTSMAVYR